MLIETNFESLNNLCDSRVKCLTTKRISTFNAFYLVLLFCMNTCHFHIDVFVFTPYQFKPDTLELVKNTIVS